MQTLEEVLEAARRLSTDERIRLVDALQRDVGEATKDEERREALSSWLRLSGRFHSDVTDVSSEKYKYLADLYADEL